MLEETQLDMGPVHWVTLGKQFIVLNTIHPQTVFSKWGEYRLMNEGEGVKVAEGKQLDF